MDGIEFLGIGSAALLLAAFAGNQFGKLSNDSLLYDGANLVAALGLFAYAYSMGVVPFMVTNAVWALVSGADVARSLLGPKRLKKR